MGNNSNQLFRKKSLEKVESPEKVNALVRVLNPGIWILIVALALAIIGILVWTFSGKISETIEVYYRSSGYAGEVIYISEDMISEIEYGQEIESDGQKGKVTGWDEEPSLAEDVMDDYLIHLNNFSLDSFVYEVRTNLMSSEGIHPAKIVIKKFAPIEFIIGNGRYEKN